MQAIKRPMAAIAALKVDTILGLIAFSCWKFKGDL
jgi:hypothetical protein